MKLFLDDNRQPYDVFKNTIDPIYENNNEWTIVKNYEEFVKPTKSAWSRAHR